MADIIFADTTRRYDGRSLETEPLGGTESSVIRLARELARRQHRVTVYTDCDTPIEHKGLLVERGAQLPSSLSDLVLILREAPAGAHGRGMILPNL
jgi:hypothetical protein